MATPCFYLNVHIEGYDTEVFLNGAPIVRSTQDYACICLPPVSEWVIDGKNELRVEVRGCATVDLDDAAADGDGGGSNKAVQEQAPDPPPIRLRVAFCRGELGELVEPGEEQELLVVESNPPGAKPLSVPFTVQDTLNVSTPWDPWGWEGAEVLELDPASPSGQDVVRFIAELHQGLAAGQLDGLLAASQIKFDEVAPCYDMDPAEASAQLQQAWPEITKPVGWTLSPWDERELVLRPCCGGRVIEPLTVKGEPLLRQLPGLADQRWMMPIYLAQLDGRLVIVR